MGMIRIARDVSPSDFSVPSLRSFALMQYEMETMFGAGYAGAGICGPRPCPKPYVACPGSLPAQVGQHCCPAHFLEPG